jgi:filamentous hemagglutinin family protein
LLDNLLVGDQSMKRHASLNRIYRLIWNRLSNTWVAVSENAKGQGKSSSRKLVAGALALTGGVFLTPMAMAGPTGGQVTAGSGSIAQAGANTTITQTSQNMAINWQSFGIAANESVRFNQPSATSIALNRILGQSPSQIFGSLSANGQVFLLNPNGVLFAPGSQVNVGGLVASTLGLSDADFMAGKFSFSKGGVAGSVVNQGTLTAAQGGYIALLAPEVRNEGVISATMGTALLAAGDKVSINLNKGSLLSYNIDQGAINALADNKQLIQADGGQVFMSAKAADALSIAVVNNTGIVEARTVQNVAGTIRLMSDMSVGTVNLAGTLDASAANGGNGGFIETSAAHVKIANDAKVTTASSSGLAGTWLIDPVDFTIAATGGDMTGTALSTALGGGNVTILSSSGASGTTGNVNVNDVVSWSSNKLTLNAQNNININASMYGSGTASLALEYGQGRLAVGNTSDYLLNSGAQVNLPAGQNFSTKLGSDGTTVNYTVITDLGTSGSITATDLQGMNGNLAGNYVLGANIDTSATSGWNLGAGFAPVGTVLLTPVFSSNTFNGVFDGLGHSISNLTINRPTENFVGLFGDANLNSAIRNVGLINGSVSGYAYVGSLVGYSEGTISNSYSTGTVSGNSAVGGLVGVGMGTIQNSFVTGNVYGLGLIGGLIGSNGGSIKNSYATGNVSGALGSFSIGGLVGQNSSSINNSYASGNVSGTDGIGGLVGLELTVFNSSMISNSYATGNVSGKTLLGGLVGSLFGSSSKITNSYWNITTSGQSTSAAGLGLTNSQMMQQSSFAGFDFANTWRIYDGHTTPLLKSFLTPITVTASGIGGNTTQTYDGQIWSGTLGTVSYSDPAAASSGQIFGNTDTTAFGNGAKLTVGTYEMMWSGQHGYDISYNAGGLLTVNPATLTLSGTTVANSKVYDGTTNTSLGGSTLVGVIAGDSVVNTGTFASKNVGTGIAVTATLGGADAGNYVLTTPEPTGLSANITPLALTVLNSTSASKVYDGTTAAFLGGCTLSGIIAGDTVTLGSIGTFASKNAGSGISVSTKLNGASAGNYIGSFVADITPKALTVSATAANKVYDGTVNDTVSLGINGVVKGDVVNASNASSVFADKNVGIGKVVAVSGIAINGTDAGNYIVNATATTAANITQKAVTVSATGSDKVYDGNLTDAVTLAGTGVVAGDVVNFTSASSNFADKNIGTGKNVTVRGISASGADAGNYKLNAVAVTTANITPLAITVSATALNKVYDGTIKDLAQLASSGVIAGDVVKFTNTSVAFSDKNAGNGKTVTVSGIKIGSRDGGNYTINTTATTTANITPKDITVTAKGSNKVYDGTVNDTVMLAVTRVIRGDVISFTNTSATFADKNAGAAKVVTVSGIAASGADAGNYTFNTVATTTAKITQKTITVAATGTNKVYDGTVNDVVFLASLGVLSGDVVNFADTSATFANNKVGAGKVVTVKGITASGADALNYRLGNTTATTTASITP